MRRILRGPLALPATMALLIGVSIPVSTTVIDLSYIPDGQGEAFRAETVYVYQNGFCQVLTTIVINVVDGQAEIELPDGAIIDTLRIDDEDVHAIVVREGDPTLLPGDRVRILVDGAIVEGKLVEVGNFWSIETKNGTLYIQPEQIRSFEILGAAAPHEGTSRVILHVAGPDGPRNVSASSIVRGLSWTPSYEIDVEKKKLTEWVTLRSPTRLVAEKLVLVVGSPSMLFDYAMDGHASLRTLVMAGSSDSAEPSWQPGSFDHFHEYTLDRPFEFKPNETVRMHFQEGSINLDEDLVAHIGRWTGDTTAQVEWTFKNSFPEPLPQGTVSFYRQGRLIGQDHLPYLPRNEEARLGSGTERDLVVKVTGKCVRQEWHFEGEATNRDTEAHELIVRFSYNQHDTLKKIEPRSASQEDLTVVWRFDLEPDGSGRFSAVVHTPKDYGGCP